MPPKKSKLYLILALAVSITSGSMLIWYARSVTAEIQAYDTAIATRAVLGRTSKPDPIIAKGLYLTAYSASLPRKREEIINLIAETELNAVVIDIKDYSGYILYDSKLPLVRELETKKPILKNLRAIINEFHNNNIYVIARQTVFQDPALAERKKDWAIQQKGGGVWRDFKGLSWVDPTKQEVWDYNMAIARETIRLGFDEINFDYVRFPSDGPISTATYADLRDSKEETMQQFYEYVRDQLEGQPAYTSYDLFGLTLETHDFDMNIGQKLRTALDTVDYIYPMTYPSHYPNGHLGFANPAEHPYEVLKNGLLKSEPLVRNASRSKIRPWLQAFNLGATYDAAKIRAQIQATEESPYTAGWMLWNAANRYSKAGLQP